MISLQAIEAKLKRFDDSLGESIKEGMIAVNKELGEKDGFPEEKIQQEITDDLEDTRKLFEETKQNRYMLYEIYFTLKVKYGRDIANLAKELLSAVTLGRMKQQELTELRTTLSSMLEQHTPPHPSSIRKLFKPIIWNYADGETRERILQELEQRRVLAEQRAEEERKQAEEERKQREEERKQREVAEQRELVLQQQILELRRQLQALQAKDSQKIAAQPEELSPISSSSGGSTQHSPQQQGGVPSSPVITTSFDMSTTRTKQPLLEQEQCTPPAKKQCLHPSQKDS